jgi:Ca2+-binding RTX toxin-like protein
MAEFMLDYSAITDPVTVDVPGDSVINGLGGDDTLTNELGEPYKLSDFFEIIGTDESDTFTAGDGGSKLTGGAGEDVLTGGLGKDWFYYQSGTSTGDAINGGGGKKDAIVVTGGAPGSSAIFNAATITGIERVIFDQENRGAVFLSSQLGKGKIREFVGAESDVDPAPRLDVTLASAGTFDLNRLTFTNWEFSQTLFVDGSDGDDTIVGHEKFFTRIDGGKGVDTMSGGKRGDMFGYGGGEELAAGEVINGKGGFDSLFLFSGGDYHFANAKLTDIENLFGDNAVKATLFFKASQIGGKAIREIGWDAGGELDIEVRGANVNLSRLTFNGLDVDDDITIFGTKGGDVLVGSSREDRIFSGPGRDLITGGGSGDTFVFNPGDSGKTATTRDRIADFETGFDKLDVETIDADGDGGNGDDAFSLLAGEGAKFTGVGAEARWYHVDKAGKANDVTIVAFDVDGNKKADFMIELAGLKNLAGGDFDL